jgi:hypothetical protein
MVTNSKEYMAAWLSKNKARTKQQQQQYNRKRRYGISESEYQAMRQRQLDRCAICGNVADVIDHDHKTGLVRGLLCRPCNVALGGFRDDPELLRAASFYLAQCAGRAA